MTHPPDGLSGVSFTAKEIVPGWGWHHSRMTFSSSRLFESSMGSAGIRLAGCRGKEKMIADWKEGELAIGLDGCLALLMQSTRTAGQ